MIFSISEITTFKRCKRKWWLSSSNHQRLTPRITGLPFALGKSVHAALAAWTVDPEWTIPQVLFAYTMESNRMVEEAEAVYREAVGTGASDKERIRMHDSIDLGMHMVLNYMNFWKRPLEPAWALVAGSEQEFLVDIPGTEHQLKGFLDHQLTGPLDKIYAMDRKTYDKRPDVDGLPYDEQFIAYTWVLGVIHGFERVAGVAYDGIWARRQPNFKSGLDWKDLFLRLTVKPTADQLNEFNAELPLVVNEMASYRATAPLEYDNVFYKARRFTCGWDCKQFVKLCNAISHDDDLPAIVAKDYKLRDVSEDRRALAAKYEATDAD